MKINHQNSSYKDLQTSKIKNGVSGRYKSAPNFSGNVIPYKNVSSAIQNIDKILGKNGFLTSKIQKAGIQISADDKIFIESQNVLEAFLSTISYPFKEMPFELIRWISNGLNKTPLNNLSNKVLNNPIIKRNLEKIDSKKSYEFVSKIFGQYYENKDLYQENTQKLATEFLHNTASKITTTAKAYASRDERTLNRMVTGGIGAILSSFDMYNISMLEKNNKDSAKKAEKSRRDQELTRVFMSAGLTFITLGVFDKYAKGSYVASSIIIAASTLFSEIVSRIIKHKPLVPLTPERAEKIAQKNESKKPKETLTKTKVALNRAYKNDKANLFKNFINADVKEEQIPNGLIKPPIGEVKITDKNKKKNKHIGMKIAIAALICNIVYLISYKQKGEYAQKMARKALLATENEKIMEFLNGGDISKLSDELIAKINKATEQKDDFLTILKKKITKTNSKTSLNYIRNQINELSNFEDTKGIKEILEKYMDEIDFLNSKGQTVLTEKVKRPVVGAVYEGFTKIFDILYKILSLPAWGIVKLQERSFNASEKVFKNVNKLLDVQEDSRLTSQYRKQLAELGRIFKKYENRQNKYDKIANIINAHTHNFEKSAETSDLASLSRTLVTLLSSYFYVNDFRNTVLIESGGKNIERAEEVTNDSISFKVCNFFFNGTLMNLFNSVFKTILNGSLVGATAVAAATEMTNEFLIRKTISRPMKKLNSREEIIGFERSQANRSGFAGWWTRNFKRLTGQKSLVEKYESSQRKKN